MKRSFWITLTASVTFCAVALNIQSMKNRSLAETLARQNAVAGKPDGRSTEPQAMAIPSDERIERTRAGIEKLMAESPDLETAKLLRMVEGLSLDELIAVTRDLPCPEYVDLPSSGTRRFLVFLAAEQDALRVSRDKKLLGERIAKYEIVRMIAKQDPVRALESLPKPPQFEASCMRCHGEAATKSGRCLYRVPDDDRWGISRQIFSADAEAGLRAFLQMEELGDPKRGRVAPLSMLAFSGSIPLNDDQLTAITAAMKDPEYASIRADLINLALTDAIYEEGVAAMAERSKSLPLTEEELKRYMESVIQDGRAGKSGGKPDILFTEPEATLQWVTEVRSETDQHKMIPDMLSNWAERDANAAFGWVSKQAPSSVRDAAINRLVTKIPNLPGESAAVWAMEIRDERMRADAVRNAVAKWQSEDPAAAEAWLRQQKRSE